MYILIILTFFKREIMTDVVNKVKKELEYQLLINASGIETEFDDLTVYIQYEMLNDELKKYKYDILDYLHSKFTKRYLYISLI